MDFPKSYHSSGFSFSTRMSSRCSYLVPRWPSVLRILGKTPNTLVCDPCLLAALLIHHMSTTGEQGASHPCIHMFWDVVGKFTEEQKQQLLRFVTSCSRPPLLGFKELHPPFCIMLGGPTDRLPTASTCMHLLKLPTFTDPQTLRSKLLYAISSGAGFELS